MRTFESFDRFRDLSLLFLRLVTGVILVEGTADNVFGWDRMVEFAHFLQSNGFPWPLPGAVVSAYAQFICGILLIAGGATRIASGVMVINFIAALLIAHRVGGFTPARPALLILAISLLLLCFGAGRFSVDSAFSRRASA